MCCCLGEAHLRPIERSYRTIFQVSFIITTGKKTRPNKQRPPKCVCFTFLSAKRLETLWTWLMPGSLPCCEKIKVRSSAVKFLWNHLRDGVWILISLPEHQRQARPSTWEYFSIFPFAKERFAGEVDGNSPFVVGARWKQYAQPHCLPLLLFIFFHIIYKYGIFFRTSNLI